MDFKSYVEEAKKWLESIPYEDIKHDAIATQLKTLLSEQSNKHEYIAALFYESFNR